MGSLCFLQIKSQFGKSADTTLRSKQWNTQAFKVTCNWRLRKPSEERHSSFKTLRKHQELNRGLWGWGFSVLQLQKKVVLPSFMSLCRLQKGEHSQYSNACLVISFQEGHHKITPDLSITRAVTHIWEEEKEMEQQSTNILVLNPCFILKSVRSSWSSSQERKAIHQIQVTNIACSVHSLHVPVCHLQTVWKVCCKHWEDSEERNRNTEKEEARQTQANSHSSIPFHYF